MIEDLSGDKVSGSLSGERESNDLQRDDSHGKPMRLVITWTRLSLPLFSCDLSVTSTCRLLLLPTEPCTVSRTYTISPPVDNRM